MNLIKQIYQKTNLEHLDYTLLHTMESAVYALAKAFERNERKDIDQLLIEASTYGQETGFIMGFRYAVKLMSECYY